MLSLIDWVVGVLGTMTLAVIDQTRKGRLTRRLVEGAISGQTCSRSEDQSNTKKNTGLRLNAEQVDSDLDSFPRKILFYPSG